MAEEPQPTQQDIEKGMQLPPYVRFDEFMRRFDWREGQHITTVGPTCSGKTVEWVKLCDQIMVEHGIVVGSSVYPTKDRARNRARALKRYMSELRLHQLWQLREHVERSQGGWVWSLEYLGRDG